MFKHFFLTFLAASFFSKVYAFSFVTQPAGFFDHFLQERMLFVEKSGLVSVLKENKIAQPLGVFTIEEGCSLNNQDTSFAHSGMTFANNYFVNMTAVCFFDSSSLRILKIADITLSDLSFSAAFLGKKGDKTYFVVNSPNELTAIEILQVNSSGTSFSKSDFVVSTKLLANNVPHASGAMLPLGDNLIVTTAIFQGPNQMHSISSNLLLNAFSKNEVVEFSKNSTLLGPSFQGMSLFLSSNGEDYLFSNSGFGNNTAINVRKQTVALVSDNSCEVIGFIYKNWHSLCGNELKITSLLTN